ncbi:MAG: phosphatidylserine/phosphatidylglycerophosphate/cardiolipin synthase family protein [Vicinamibacterales bacterium]
MPAASQFVPLWDRVAEWTRRLAMIRNARSFLYLSTFYIEWDAYARELLDALDDAQRRGVDVALLVDGFGQRLGGTLMSLADRQALSGRLDALRSAGATVTRYRPAHAVQRFVGGGQHVKIQAADTGEAIFGSSNITKSSFEGWNEFSVAVRGPIVRTLLESWPGIGGSVPARHLAALDRISAGAEGTSSVSACNLDYWFCNPNLAQGPLGPFLWRGPNAVTARMVEMLDAARSTAQITAFYFKPVPQLMDAVLRAARRGVAVEVFHSHREALPATDLAWIAAAVNYPRLLGAGVTIVENRRGEHSKIVVIDGTWVALGSYNFEDAAHDRLAEAMLASRDQAVVEPAQAIIEGLRIHPDNVRVTPDWRDCLPVALRGKMAVMGPFKRWM